MMRFKLRKSMLVVLVVAGVARMAAQDVVITPLDWMGPEVADELPSYKSPPRVKFPADLKNAPEINWGMADVLLDASGAVTSFRVAGSGLAYEKAIRDAGAGKFKPAKRAGVPVKSRVRLTVAFNPASASERTQDATPRLLDAKWITDPARPKGAAPHVDWITVALDEHGRVTGISKGTDQLSPLLEREMRLWKFAPARQAGRPVAATVSVPVVIVAPEDLPTADSVPPRVLRRSPPQYPLAMRMSGLRGEVLVEFVVNKEGKVVAPTVVRSLNPAFNEAAIEAIQRWAFEPGRVNGKPVNTKMQQPISFALEGMQDGGGDGLEVTRRGDPSKMPEELRYDVPPKIDALLVPVYPYELLQKRTRGSATVAMMVGADGKVHWTKVTKATHPEFGFALQAAVARFEYQPASRAGRPTPAVLRFTQKFDASETASVSAKAKALLALEKKHPERIVGGDRLDDKLERLTALAPVPPSPAPDVSGQALVEFLIDEEGRVQLPRVVSASAPEFGYAAAQAVALWTFAPPKSQGKPVSVRAQIPFSFASSGAAPAPAAKP